MGKKAGEKRGEMAEELLWGAVKSVVVWRQSQGEMKGLVGRLNSADE